MIDELGLAGFFLLHHEMLELAREVAVEVRGPDSVRALLAPGRGRGSSVSSLVCYLIGLSHIDPIANRLALGRFLHEDLRGLPDIDLDFPRDIREVLIPRVHERYRARPRGAGRGLPDLPRARRDPRAGQGARPAARRDRAHGARRRALRAGPSTTSPPARASARRSVAARTREREAGDAARRRARSAGAGWRGSSSRPTGCRATSPSTPAG